MKVVHCKKEKFDIYIGRPSKWGNPFSHKQDTQADYIVSSREEAISMFEEWFRLQESLMNEIDELEGKTLGCWCKPKACHGDILLKILEEKRMKNKERSDTLTP